MSVVIETTLGDFTVDLYTAERPNTCLNFLKLCKIKYYNFCLFHSVQHNFIAQTGDPTGTGKNGESIFGKIFGEEKKFFEAEMIPKIKHSKGGVLSMVNCGNNMLGSQFFLTLSSDLQSLDGEHCVFGEVAEGHEILLKLNEVICDTEHRPYQDIRITHTVVLEDPFDDPLGLVEPDSSPEPNAETLVNSRIAADEDIDDTKGMTTAELEEIVRNREAQAQATILEIVGDLPDADMAPPENVLFVCKLNPVTSDDDLEIIFSRFGKVKGCEVIRDKITGDSLQYAFVEFEDQKSCEDAYFKMDNVLIDDRRIHVDFSQSVSKLRWKGKGRGVEHIDENAPKKEEAGNKQRSNVDVDHGRSREERPRSDVRKGREETNGRYESSAKGGSDRVRSREDVHRNGDRARSREDVHRGSDRVRSRENVPSSRDDRTRKKHRSPELPTSHRRQSSSRREFNEQSSHKYRDLNRQERERRDKSDAEHYQRESDLNEQRHIAALSRKEPRDKHYYPRSERRHDERREDSKSRQDRHSTRDVKNGEVRGLCSSKEYDAEKSRRKYGEYETEYQEKDEHRSRTERKELRETRSDDKDVYQSKKDKSSIHTADENVGGRLRTKKDLRKKRCSSSSSSSESSDSSSSSDDHSKKKKRKTKETKIVKKKDKKVAVSTKKKIKKSKKKVSSSESSSSSSTSDDERKGLRHLYIRADIQFMNAGYLFENCTLRHPY